MGLLSNIANSIPGVGHVKGLYHYAKGEEKKGDEAIYQSTRGLMVIGGGIVGGPPGAIAAGMATDITASALMKEEKGLVESCKNIGDDMANNRNPTRSIVNAGLQLSFDGLTGYGGGSSGEASKSSVRVFGKTMERGAEQSIQKSARISAAEIAKMGGRQSSKRLATKTAERGLVIASNIGLTAVQRSELERQEERERERNWREREQREREKKRRERERERESAEEEEESEREEEQQRIWWRMEKQHSERERYWKEEQESEWEEDQESEWEEEQQRSWWKMEEPRIERERYWKEEQESERWQSMYRRYIEQEESRERELSGENPCLWIYYPMFDQSENKQSNQSDQQKSKKQEESKKKEQRANSEKQNRDSSGLISVSEQPPQPPQGNKDNNKKGKKIQEPSFFDNFLALLKKILNIVYGNKSEPFLSIFQNLSKEDRKYLVKVLKPLVKSGTLEAVIELVIRMFQKHFPQDVSFLNFLSLLEFVQTYITDELQVRTLISNGTDTADAEMTPQERRDKIISEIASEKDIVKKLIEQFEELKIEIEAETAAWNEQFPNFRDIFAAVYHYFKHRRLPHDASILTVKEYYDWIRKYLKELEKTQKLTELRKSQDEIYVREMFEPQFRRRFKIVLNCHGEKIVLSSAYVVTPMHPDDKEKHVIVLVAEILTIFTAVYILYTFRNVVFNSLMLVLNLPLSISIFVFNCTAFVVTFLLHTLLFLFVCLIFILKVFLCMLLIFVFVWYLFFYLPDQR